MIDNENATNDLRPPQTHYAGCWREPGHHACAITEVERLRGFLVEVGQLDAYCWCCQKYVLAYPVITHSDDCRVYNQDGRIKEHGE